VYATVHIQKDRIVWHFARFIKNWEQNDTVSKIELWNLAPPLALPLALLLSRRQCLHFPPIVTLLPSDQDLCPFTRLGALPSDPRYRLALLHSPWGRASPQILRARTAAESRRPASGPASLRHWLSVTALLVVSVWNSSTRNDRLT